MKVTLCKNTPRFKEGKKALKRTATGKENEEQCICRMPKIFSGIRIQRKFMFIRMVPSEWHLREKLNIHLILISSYF